MHKLAIDISIRLLGGFGGYGATDLFSGNSLDTNTHNFDNSVCVFNKTHLIVDDSGYHLIVVHGGEL